MSVKAFFSIVGVLVLCLLGWCVWQLTHQWEYSRVGPYAIRRNVVTGLVQIEKEGAYVTPFTVDPYATPVGPEDLKRLQFVDAAWDPNGILCARALVAPGAPIQGRLAIQIQVMDIKRGKRMRDRTLRATVDWPGGALTPFVLRTGLATPDNVNEKTTLTPQPTLYSGD